jgi:hypothetical protein
MAFSKRIGVPVMIKRLSFWFALTGYFLTFLYYFGPWGIAYSAVLDQSLLFRMCIFRDSWMPLSPVMLFISPINAVIYGIAGAAIGWVFPALLAMLRET